MKESLRLRSLFEKLYDGDPWIDISLLAVLNNISAKQAAARPLPNCNSIWEIVNHLVCWRQNVLQRIGGKAIKTPAHNYFERVKDTSEKAWSAALRKLETTQTEWLAVLGKMKKEDFEKRYAANNMTHYEHINGILQHDSYHLGQIVMLSKLV
ncbi:MAG: DinB family protein [Ferruginibacter sp.]